MEELLWFEELAYEDAQIRYATQGSLDVALCKVCDKPCEVQIFTHEGACSSRCWEALYRA